MSGMWAGSRKYIVDVVGDLPVILMELDGSGNVAKTYIYANSQILAQHDGDYGDARYFYLHDRLGSVREIINSSGSVVVLYTYNPFGEVIESDGSFANPFMFTGQYYDSEIDLYYLRARQYHPHIGRFTARDPVEGCFKEPMSWHKYLYAQNDPINKTDPTGKSYIINTIYGVSNYYAMLDAQLNAAGADWDAILDAAVGVNTWREQWFTPQNLRSNRYVTNWAELYVSRQVYRIESETLGIFADALHVLENGCDYKGLAKCLGWTSAQSLLRNAIADFVGSLSCELCVGWPDPSGKAVFCAGCGVSVTLFL